MCAEVALSLACVEAVESVDLEESIILGLAESVALMSVLLGGNDVGEKSYFVVSGLRVEAMDKDPCQDPSGRMNDVFVASRCLSDMRGDILLVAAFAGLLAADGWSMLMGKIRSPSWMLDHDERGVDNVAEEYGICAEEFTLEMSSVLSMA